ncbi:unnamed protein product [Lupinus luteus]|uniref:Uncharacterized protein n=1 Tax=Lupinus luteus TaxID=3873 RepID=A0AAV1VXB4_LUPLU
MLKVKEWLQNIDGEDVPLHHQDESAKDRDVPSSVALPIIQPALGRLQSILGRAKISKENPLGIKALRRTPATSTLTQRKAAMKNCGSRTDIGSTISIFHKYLEL